MASLPSVALWCVDIGKMSSLHFSRGGSIFSGNSSIQAETAFWEKVEGLGEFIYFEVGMKALGKGLSRSAAMRR